MQFSYQQWLLNLYNLLAESSQNIMGKEMKMWILLLLILLLVQLEVAGWGLIPQYLHVLNAYLYLKAFPWDLQLIISHLLNYRLTKRRNYYSYMDLTYPAEIKAE